MAKYERFIRGNFDEVLALCERAVMGKSTTAELEDKSDVESNGVRVAVRVYERFSWLGSSRVSLNITLVGTGDDLYLVAIGSGGSQAVFFKINTYGESNFLATLSEEIEAYCRNSGQ